MLAPIIVFAYNRPHHLSLCIQALRENAFAKDSPLFVFSDGPKTEKDTEKVCQVRGYLRTIEGSADFKSVEIHESKCNKGLANSVIEGVSQIMARYQKVIVVEDDAIVSNNFLHYMNSCLDLYEEDKKIGAIGGFTIPIDLPTNFKDDVFLMKRGSSYSWATWKNRWDTIDWEVKTYKKFKYNFFDRRKFNEYDNGLSSLLDYQMYGVINSWAIRFSYSMYKQSFLWVMPRLSKVRTIGFDGLGTNCDAISIYDNVKLDNGKETQDYSNAIFRKDIALLYKKHFSSRFSTLRNSYLFLKNIYKYRK